MFVTYIMHRTKYQPPQLSSLCTSNPITHEHLYLLCFIGMLHFNFTFKRIVDLELLLLLFSFWTGK